MNDELFKLSEDGTVLIEFIGGDDVTEVTIPEGVTKIGRGAFDGCSSLTSITIPEGVTEIGWRAFDGCSSLTSITIPENVTNIGGNAFAGCSSLTEINIPKSVTEIGWRAFAGCSSLTQINILESVTKIGGRAFWGCSSLTSIKIPESVKKIGGSAFYGCHSLTSIYIPNSIESIENNVFEDCTNIEYLNYNCDLINPQDCGWKLKTVDIGNSVTKIEEGAFCHCRSLTSINVDSNNPYFASIDGVLFNKGKTILIKYPEGKEQNSYTIPVSVTEIGEGAFDSCSNLLKEDNGIRYIDCIAIEATDRTRTSYKLKEGTRFISEHAFGGCRSLTSINIPESVTKIGKGAFACCESLIEINIPEGVTEIGRYAFINCEKLESITIPDSVTKIGESAFDGCKILTSINIPECAKEIGDWAFLRCEGLESITIPEGVTEIGIGAFEGCKNLTFINIPESVTEIEDYVFKGCASLTSITFPEGVKEIGENAFAGCKSLTEINIPEGVKEIGKKAFDECSNLTVICSENIANAIDTKSVKEVKVRKKVCCSMFLSYYYFNDDKLSQDQEDALAEAQECCYGGFDLTYPEVYVTKKQKTLIVNIECNKEEIRKRRNEIDKEYPNASEEEKEELKKENEKLIELSEKLGNRDSGTIEDEIIISGEYIRHYPGEKAKIFLYDINNQSPEQLVATYVHEMMHASYDYNHHVYNKYTSCVEEPLTEYGALRLLEDMGTSYFDAAYKSVKAKQYSPGVCHYGFGAYLYDQHKKSQSPVNWERMMAAAKYGLCSEDILQTEYGKRFSSGCYPHHDEATKAHELMCILRDGVQMAQKGRNAFICYCTYILGMQDYETINICSTLDGLLRRAPSVVGRGPLLRICDLYNQRDIKYVKTIRARKDLHNSLKKPLDLYIQFLEDTRPEVIALRKGTKF